MYYQISCSKMTITRGIEEIGKDYKKNLNNLLRFIIASDESSCVHLKFIHGLYEGF